MLVTAGGNFDRADTLFRFGAMYGPAIHLFPEQVWRSLSAIFVHIGGNISLSIMLSLLLSWLGKLDGNFSDSKNFFLSLPIIW